MLSKPKDKLGYQLKEILKICKKNNINLYKFWDTFGYNTCIIAKDGTNRYYACDVERALYKMGSKLGKEHLWD